MIDLKIISGGQTGADMAGLDAAKNSDVPTGGWATKGWRICNPDGSPGKNPALADYGLVEHANADYPSRTKQNIKDADGTALFGYLESPGAKLAIKTSEAKAKKLDKDVDSVLFKNPTGEELAAWITTNNIKVLNVAGNRKSKHNKTIYLDTYWIICTCIRTLRGVTV